MRGRYTLRCDSCRAIAHISDDAPPADPDAELVRFADTQCPRGGTSGGCPNTTDARADTADRRPARLLARLREAWDQIRQAITDLRALEARQPRTVLVAVPALSAGRHDLPVSWPAELPAVPRVQVTAETPRAGVAAVRGVVLAGSRTTSGCTVVLDLTTAVGEGQAWLHVTATP